MIAQVVMTTPALTGKGGLLEKMNIQASSNFRRGVRFEGLKYSCGDFVVSCAQASSLGGAKQFIGSVADVEYLPVSDVTVAKPILEVSGSGFTYSTSSHGHPKHICSSLVFKLLYIHWKIGIGA